ncbi:MAG: Asp-tRNA(Asn)/Glu-tRNA(Gln) amidotransferase subunit GatA [Acidithiobacillus sp.]
MELHQMGVAELSAGLRNKDFSAMELSSTLLQRLRQAQDSLNACITISEEPGLEQARAADQRRAQGDSAPLLGIPLAHKDIFCTRGQRTTCGSKMLAEFVSPYDATVVQRFQKAGMVTLGKLNMDEFAMGSSNETSFFGAVRNPWDLTRVPGGSSGGSAAALAARLLPAATGTDTGGSIRQPAAFCGVTGLKPTYGRVSRYGMIAFASSLDQGGPMARSAADCALLMDVMAGHDPLDSTSHPQAAGRFSAALGRSVKGLRIGVPEEFFGEGLDPEVAQAVQEAIQWYVREGAEIRPVHLPNNVHAVSTYYVLAPAEASSNLSRFDGIRYSHRSGSAVDLQDLYLLSRYEGFGPEVRRRILVGSYVLSAGYYDAYYRKAQQLRALIREDFRRAFAEVDVIMGPTTPTPAFALGAKSADPVAMYLADIYTIAVNLAGIPALSLPCGFSKAGLPIGLQIMGNYFADELILGLGDAYQRDSDWHQQEPGWEEQ